jgi:hypothetical protein
MSGIPVYTASPINPSRASGVIPQTSNINSNPGGPATASATTTATTTSPYPSAQPQAAAFPGPTSSAQKQYAPPNPTPTTKTASDGPPPPQPGAFPVARNAVPPPPKVGEKYEPTNPTLPQSMPKPYQTSLPPPNTAFRAQPVASTTATASTPYGSYPVPIAAEYGTPRQSLEHPPGYQQDSYASELTSDQRRALDANNSSSLGGTSESVGSINTENIWNTTKQWASTAGRKMSETEAEIWRRISKD